MDALILQNIFLTSEYKQQQSPGLQVIDANKIIKRWAWWTIQRNIAQVGNNLSVNSYSSKMRFKNIKLHKRALETRKNLPRCQPTYLLAMAAHLRNSCSPRLFAVASWIPKCRSFLSQRKKIRKRHTDYNRKSNSAAAAVCSSLDCYCQLGLADCSLWIAVRSHSPHIGHCSVAPVPRTWIHSRRNLGRWTRSFPFSRYSSRQQGLFSSTRRPEGKVLATFPVDTAQRARGELRSRLCAGMAEKTKT